MKSTRYFDDYQSAYNYYGGNVVPSTEIALIGNGSYIFVSSDNAVSGNQQYFDASMTNDEIVDTMTYTAYNNGVAYGTTYGEAIGYTTGHTAGYSEGYSYGYSYGYTEGQAQGGGMTLTDAQIEQMSMGMFMSGNDSVISNSGTFEINTFGVTSEYIKSRIEAEMGLYIDKYNTTDGLVDISASLDVTITYHEDGDDGYISAIIPLVTGDKVGFGFYSIETDPESGDSIISSEPSQYLKDVYWIDGDNNEGYNHFHDIATTGNYEARWQLSMDPISGDTIYEFTLQIVQQ